MAEDELENLRAIVARANQKPQKKRRIRSLFYKLVSIFFISRKKPSAKQVPEQPDKRNVA